VARDSSQASGGRLARMSSAMVPMQATMTTAGSIAATEASVVQRRESVLARASSVFDMLSYVIHNIRWLSVVVNPTWGGGGRRDQRKG